MTGRLAFVLVTLALLVAAPAQAHRLKVFASAEGSVVTGYAYFSGGGRAKDLGVTAAGPDGVAVFESVTGEDGQFAFEARQRMDHIVTVDGSDGHHGSFTIRAAELPASLPVGAEAVAVDAPVAAAPDLSALIDEAVVRQVRPLREQIEAYQDEIRLRDVIGGLGYIIGLAGLAYGFSRRRG